MNCPLCGDCNSKVELAGADERRYCLCGQCWLIFVDPHFYLTAEQEKAFYGTHQNSPENAGYVSFLSQLCEPMLTRLKPSMRGLDYGCGPGPTLSILFQQAGMHCEDYDPFFQPSSPTPPYDFIVSTETFEHFFDPKSEIETISSMLSPGGYLGVMTERWLDTAKFSTWYYTKDPTHVCFYHQKTFDFICHHYGYVQVFSLANRVLILRKNTLPI